jgi:hypothetical protein
VLQRGHLKTDPSTSGLSRHSALEPIRQPDPIPGSAWKKGVGSPTAKSKASETRDRIVDPGQLARNVNNLEGRVLFSARGALSHGLHAVGCEDGTSVHETAGLGTSVGQRATPICRITTA